MHHVPVRKNLTHEYQTPATPEAVCAALQRLTEAIPGVTVSQPAPDEARVEGPGILIRVKLRAAAGWTFVVTSFKTCAQWA